MKNTTPLIEFQDIYKSFGNRTILNGINLKIFEGQATVIIGKSGVGKSVLLKHIIGLLEPDKGCILFKGKPIDRMSRDEWNTYISRISYMFQNNALFDSLTVYENIALPLRQTTGMTEKEIEKKVMARIDQTELVEEVYKYPSELSGGMQKRVALARALVTDPEIILFDEPTSGQDIIRRNAILSMIAEYQKRFGFTAILISHDVPDVFFISNRILLLYEGRIIFQGPADKIEEFDHPFVDEFIGSLESFKEQLTGLYSKRYFKVQYQSILGLKEHQKVYVVGIFGLGGFDLLCNSLGHTTGQEIIKTMGERISRHFGAVGGFAARHSRDQFIIVLPFSDIREAEQILDDFVRDLTEHGIRDIPAVNQITEDTGFNFSISAGLAEGKPAEDIDSIVESAWSKRKIIAQFQCKSRR